MIKRIKNWYKRTKFLILDMGDNIEGLAQIGHFLAGVVCADWFSWQGCLVLSGGWVFPKEIILDPRSPENASFLPQGKWYGKSGIRDMTFYFLGMGVGILRRWKLGLM